MWRNQMCNLPNVLRVHRMCQQLTMQQDQTCNVTLGTVPCHVCHVRRAPINNRQVRQFHQMAHSSADMMNNALS